MATQVERKRAEETPAIPDRLYFKIGDVARICGLEAYVLRFWESQFPQLKPNKSGTGQRLYRKRDVELAMRVRRLLHDEGYTIAGARQVLAQESSKTKAPQLPLIAESGDSAATKARLQRIRGELRELLGLLSLPPAPRSERAEKGPVLAGRSERKARQEAAERGPNLFE